jgi:hypothetical protein
MMIGWKAGEIILGDHRTVSEQPEGALQVGGSVPVS